MAFGEHTVTAELAGYHPVETKVAVERAGSWTVCGIALTRISVEIPRRSISIDGSPADWRGLDPIAAETAADDKLVKSPGTNLSKAFLCRDDTYLYWRVDFDDGVPNAPSDRIVECSVNLGQATGRRINAELRVQWKEGAGKALVNIVSYLPDKQVRTITQDSAYKVGDGMVEARFPISVLAGFPDAYEFEFRVWESRSWAETSDAIHSVFVKL